MSWLLLILIQYNTTLYLQGTVHGLIPTDFTLRLHCGKLVNVILHTGSGWHTTDFCPTCTCTWIGCTSVRGLIRRYTTMYMNAPFVPKGNQRSTFTLKVLS